MPHESPVYTNWEFWSAILAGIAILLSQLPPVLLWFRPRRLEVEVHNRVQILDKVGNPNVSMYVSIRNTGGRALRVSTVKLDIGREGVSVGTFPAQNYFEQPSSKSSVLFVPFDIKPGDSWAHTMTFLNIFDRATEKLYRQSSSALREDVRKKIAERDTNAKEGDKKEAVIGEPSLVEPFLDLHSRLFVWAPGEYAMTLQVSTDGSSSTYSRKYRFTLYESDTDELRSYVDSYKFGAGIFYTDDKQVGVFVPISAQRD